MIQDRRKFGSLSTGQRALSLSAAVGLNAAALAMLLLLRASNPLGTGDPAGSEVMISVAIRPQTEPLPVVVKTPLLKSMAASAAPVELSSAAASSAKGTAADCPIAEDVAKGIIADPEALAAVINAPPETRSIADAIVLWNAAWAPATASDTPEVQAPLEPVRTNVQATLQALPEDCLSLIVTGPRLIAVPNGGRTMILVFGSGDWAWQTLIDPAPASEQAPAAMINWWPIPGA